ncbi:MAG: NAD(P)H-binding protein [Pseudomonadota bacterium]
MHLLVIGGSKGIGLKTVEAALAKGYNVRAFARGADAISIDSPLLEGRSGDALAADDIATALEGVDVVISALGVKERLAMLWQEERLFSQSTELLISAMKEAGKTRLIVVTGFGAGDSKAAMSAIERLGHKALLGRPYADKDRQEAMIESSDLDWTIARPVILRNTPKVGPYRILTEPSTWRNGLISRAEVSDFLVRAAEEDLYIKQAVVLTR